jgi:HTH-type transcriptional regulator / antitoxin HigA
MLTKIRSEKEYQIVMKTIESLLEKATAKGGFHELSKDESEMLAQLSKIAESYEDETLDLMPIRPNSLKQALELKMAELEINQAALAALLGIGAPKLSQIMNGKREPDLTFLKAAHQKLHLDAAFLLSC